MYGSTPEKLRVRWGHNWCASCAVQRVAKEKGQGEGRTEAARAQHLGSLDECTSDGTPFHVLIPWRNDVDLPCLVQPKGMCGSWDRYLICTVCLAIRFRPKDVLSTPRHLDNRFQDHHVSRHRLEPTERPAVDHYYYSAASRRDVRGSIALIC